MSMSLEARAVAGWVLCAVALAGCRETSVSTETVRPVRAVKVGDLNAVRGREFPGRARAKDEVDLSFQVAGSLVSLPVDVGTKVKKGDLVASLDPRDFQTALDTAQGNLERARANLLAMERGARPEEIEQLKAEVEEAEALHRQAAAEYARDSGLLDIGAATPSEVEISRARAESTAAKVKVAKEALNIGTVGARPEDLEAKRAEIRALEAAVANAQNQLAYAVLTAPFDGEVVARYVSNFQTVQAKQPIVRLLDVTRIEVTVQVPESLIALVPQVKDAVIQFDALPEQEFVGRVTKIGSEASQTTRTYPVTVEIEQLDGVRILPGMAATVRGRPQETQEDEPHDIAIPFSSVFSGGEGEQSYVWVVDEASGEVSRRAVTTGPLNPVGIRILEGLEVGEWVVSVGVNSLRENQRVEILAEGSQ